MIIKKNPRSRGAEFEDRACVFLQMKGYNILARNYRNGRYSEVDIICMDGNSLVGVEVKGVSFEWDDSCIRQKVSPLKLSKVRSAVFAYMSQEDMTFDEIRVDVLLVRSDRVVHYKNVV